MTREEMIRKIWREEYMSEPKMTNKTVSFDKPSGNDTVSLEVSDTVDENGDRVWRKAEQVDIAFAALEGEKE